ncbi:MAG: CPBP family intramembrane glutamic endopeptidase, partial [Anaerolineae bacterium]
CLALLRWRAQVEDLRLREIIGFQRRRFLRDLGWGLLWSMVLFALMMGGFLATTLAIGGITGLTFEQIHMGSTDYAFEVPQWLTVTMLIVSGIVFPILNAPVEELQYRGYAQTGLMANSRSIWLGIGIPALGFGLQHIAFAYTLHAAPVYAVSFLLWGLGAGYIFYRQGRLAPLIIAHFISNLFTGIAPLLFMLMET